MRLALLANRKDIHTVRWLNALAERGHELHLLSMHPPQDPIDPRVQIHRLPVPAPAGYLLNGLALRQMLAQIRPDLLHIFFASGYGTLGHLSGFRPRILSVLGADVYDFPARSPLHRWLVARNIRTADRVCATSQVMAHQTRTLYPAIAPQNLTVIPFGIDVERFRPAPPQQANGLEPPEPSVPPIVVGTVKKLQPKYAIDILLRAFAAARATLARRAPALSHRLRLLLVGGGPQRAALEALAFELGVEDVTTFVGRVPHCTVPDYLGQLDIYVAVSRLDSESFGVAVLEASACGLPVVVSDAGGLPEVVRHEETGLITRREDVAAVAAALLRLIEQPDVRQRLGAAGRDHVRTTYNWVDSVTQMEAVYQETRGTPYD